MSSKGPVLIGDIARLAPDAFDNETYSVNINANRRPSSIIEHYVINNKLKWPTTKHLFISDCDIIRAQWWIIP